MLKRWFIEPRANVFVGTVNRKVREKTMAFLRRHSEGWSALVVHSDPNCQGFVVDSIGKPKRKMVKMCGLQLILEKSIEVENEDPEAGGTETRKMAPRPS
jgi:CRISPR-associated protein Cas2